MLNIGIVGCGYWGPNLIRNFTALSECNVKKLCDADSKRLQSMASLYPTVEQTSNYIELVEDDAIDAIVIATPVRFHFEMAMQSLLAGKHTFVEKPMVRTVREGMLLINAAKNRGLTLMVGHTFIYSPAVRKIKEIVAANELGDIQYIAARRLNLGLFQNDINVAWDLTPHDISIINFVLEESPVSINCQGKAHINPEIEDITNMVLNYANGRIATIQSSWLDPNKVRDMTFVGSKKMLLYDDLEPIEKIKIYDKRVEIPPHYDTFAEFHYSYHYGDIYSPYLKQYEPLRRECLHFLDCIKTGEKSESCGDEALKVVQILEKATESLNDGGGKVIMEDLEQMASSDLYN
jgi:predicted dehydrogenase